MKAPSAFSTKNEESIDLEGTRKPSVHRTAPRRSCSLPRAWPARFGIAVGSTVSAVVLTHALWPILRHTPFILGFGAAILSSRLAGRHAGFLAVSAGVIGYAFFPVPMPDYGIGGLPGLLVGYAAISGTFSWIVARRYEIEQALRSSESRLAEAQQLANIGSWEWNVVDGTDTWSDEVYRIFGIEPRSIQPSFEAFSRYLHPEDRVLVDGVVRQALIDHRPFHYDHRIIRPNGEVRTLHVQGRVVVEHARVIRIVGTAQDITERKAAEETVGRSERRLKTILDAQPACVKLVSAGGELLEMNPAGLRILGANDLSEVVRRPVIDFIHPDDQESVLRVHCAAAASVAGRVEFRIIGLDRTERWVDSHMVPLEAAATDMGPLKPVLSVTSDITERKQLEEQLQQAQKMDAIGRLAGGIAHDFNNLLTVIAGLTDAAIHEIGDDTAVSEDLQEVSRAAHSAAALTRQLLLFSRKQVVQMTALDLNAVISHVEKLLRRSIGEDIVLQTRLAPDVRSITGDAAQLQQVLMNLAVNARDAMPSGGALLIETADVDLEEGPARKISVMPGRYVKLTVTDTGHGMDSDTKARIFEPFFTTKERGRGTGLGLATVYGIVQNVGGTISVTSEIGHGTTFKLYFPEAPAPATRAVPTPASAQETLTGTETVMLVEDDEGVRAFGARVLRMAGYDVLEASCPREVLELLRREERRVDAILTDIIMPEMNGCELAKRVSATHPETRVLYMSGYTDQAIREHDLSVDSNLLLEKPFTAVELLRRMRGVLDSPEPSYQP